MFNKLMKVVILCICKVDVGLQMLICSRQEKGQFAPFSWVWSFISDPDSGNSKVMQCLQKAPASPVTCLQQTEKQTHPEELPQRATQWLEQAHLALVRPLAHGHSSLVLVSRGMKRFQVYGVEKEKVLTCQGGFVFRGRGRRMQIQGMKNTSPDGLWVRKGERSFSLREREEDADSLMDLCGIPLVLASELSHRAHIL